MSRVDYPETAPTLTHGRYGAAEASQWAVLAQLGPVMAQMPATGEPIRLAYDALVNEQRALSAAFDAFLDALDGADAGTKDEAFAVLAGGAA